MEIEINTDNILRWAQSWLRNSIYNLNERLEEIEVKIILLNKTDETDIVKEKINKLQDEQNNIIKHIEIIKIDKKNLNTILNKTCKNTDHEWNENDNHFHCVKCGLNKYMFNSILK